MKKNLVLLWGVVLFLSLCVNCSNDNENGNEEGKNPLEENYFTIESAVFHEGDLPSGNYELLYDLSVNSNVITGGSALISFSSTEPLLRAFVGVEGTKGYYEYDLVNTQKNISTEFNYEIVVLISQNISDKDFTFKLSVETIDGKLSPEESADVDVIEAGMGDLQISLSWDQPDDLDLHVIDPLGNYIYYAERYSVKGSEEIEDEEEDEFNFAIYMIKNIPIMM